jgi:hypothetical protein
VSYIVKSNRSSYHIDGIATRTQGTGEDTGTGAVPYFAESVCGALTRGRFQEDFVTEDLAEALKRQQLLASVYNKRACLNCSRAAESVIAQED